MTWICYCLKISRRLFSGRLRLTCIAVAINIGLPVTGQSVYGKLILYILGAIYDYADPCPSISNELNLLHKRKRKPLNTLLTTRLSKNAFKLAAGIGVLLIFVQTVNPGEILLAVRSTDMRLAGISFMAFSAQGIFESYRLVLVFTSYKLGIREGFKLFFVGLFFGNFMLGTIGSDAYQVYYMNNLKPGLLRPLTLSIFLRLMGLFSNIVIGSFAIYLSKIRWTDKMDLHLSLTKISTIFLLCVFVAFITLRANRMRNYLASVREKITIVFNDFLYVANSFSFSQLTLIVLLSVFVILSRATGLYVLLEAFGASASYINLIATVTITTLITSLPFSFAGLGVREISVAVLLVSFGVLPVVATATAIVSRFFIWLLSLIGGTWFLLKHEDGTFRRFK